MGLQILAASPCGTFFVGDHNLFGQGLYWLTTEEFDRRYLAKIRTPQGVEIDETPGVIELSIFT
jgi:hypothetical protein